MSNIVNNVKVESLQAVRYLYLNVLTENKNMQN